ncbi:MAG: homoserine dehydrogenase [Acidobacteriota bacterium]|nr:homoserine dehydrogenase [Acidobacteriota bacterium]
MTQPAHCSDPGAIIRKQGDGLFSERQDLVLRIALVGFGTVGQSVARILWKGEQRPLILAHICNRRVERKIVDWAPDTVAWTSDFGDVLRSDADVVVELIGGLEPAGDWIRQALEAGKSVVTANKQVMAHVGADLMRMAAERQRHLLFEAAVAGGIPIIRAVREGLAGDRLRRVLGVLNGTCNYMLTRMEAGQVSFDDALREAQEQGYAEADPTADVDGGDAQAKLAILSAVGLGRQVAAGAIPLRSIRPVEPVDFNYARRLGCTIRQVSRAEASPGAGGDVTASVQPMLVPLTSPLARAEGSQNVVVVEGTHGGETAFRGFGAGGDPTAVAIVSDLEAIARTGVAAPRSWRPPAAAQVEPDFEAPQYLRFVIVDRPGIIASLASVFWRHGLNIDSVLQEPDWPKSALPFVVTLEPCSSRAVQAALTEIEAFDFHARAPVWMPILPRGERSS